MDLITIVIAVYNAERTIEKCVDSLLSQSYKNIEIILVDDCSTDRSLEICKDYVDKYSNISVLSNEKNSGVSFTRNRGIDAANGKYICFVDSDDYVESNYLEILYNIYQEYDLFPICGFVFHDDYNGVKPVEYRWSGGCEKVSLGEAFRLNDELYLTALWNKLFITEIIKGKNIRFDTDLSMGEDLRFSVNYFESLDSEYIYAISNPLYNYVRNNDNSLMSEFGLNGIKSAVDNLYLIKKLAEKYNDKAECEYEIRVERLKENFIYFIVRAKKMPAKEKIERIRQFKPEFSKINYVNEKFKYYKEKIYGVINR